MRLFFLNIYVLVLLLSVCALPLEENQMHIFAVTPEGNGISANLSLEITKGDSFIMNPLFMIFF